MGNSESSSFAGTAVDAVAWALSLCCSRSSDNDYQRVEDAEANDVPEPKRKRKRPTIEQLQVEQKKAESHKQPCSARKLGKLREAHARSAHRTRSASDGSFTGIGIKLMCYNLWSPDVKLHERMKAISKLIEQHSPDIILLQEVTPSIYKIFQDCNWWVTYSCSVTAEKATRKFFCMLLSKLPVKKSRYRYLKSSSEGKGLCIAWINAGEKKLVVSTCHLKRPATTTDTNSTERVAQATEALSILRFAPNVVLGGDMNWDDDSDGSFPLVDGWFDAWSVLRPQENGWTYDTKSNGMLRYSRLLQRRLDRFLCKLKDFELVSIDMVGMKAIPKILHKVNNKRKVPVLPSDHYGLILTICLK